MPEHTWPGIIQRIESFKKWHRLAFQISDDIWGCIQILKKDRDTSLELALK